MGLSLDLTWGWMDRRAGTLVFWMGEAFFFFFILLLLHAVHIIMDFAWLTFVTNPAICYSGTGTPGQNEAT